MSKFNLNDRTLNGVEALVRQVMQDCPITRNCDKVLQALIMRDIYGIRTFAEYVASPNCIALESIRRVRQKIQAKGELLPTDPKVLEERFKKVEEYVDYAVS